GAAPMTAAGFGGDSGRVPDPERAGTGAAFRGGAAVSPRQPRAALVTWSDGDGELAARSPIPYPIRHAASSAATGRAARPARAQSTAAARERICSNPPGKPALHA